MSLRLPDKWVWDFWFVRRGGERHLFYLQAPRSLGDVSLRHHNATIGHAVSGDLRDWQVLPDALHPGPDGSWDDLATWTGSAIGHDGRWYMLYTGINRAEQGLVQRVGLASSDDLVQWYKYPGNPVLEADPRWYEVLGEGRWRDQSWRDPWLFRCVKDGQFHVLVTARSRFGEPDGAGVIGYARSANLVDWDVLPPLTEPGEFAQLEVPQLAETQRGYLILFSCHSEDHSRMRQERLGSPGRGGTFAMWAEHFSGPWLSSLSPVETPGDRELGAAYGGKLIEGEDGQWEYMAFRGDDDRDFLGELAGPYPVQLARDGSCLVVSVSGAFPNVATAPDRHGLGGAR
jgi:beta-fructofuranosidase